MKKNNRTTNDPLYVRIDGMYCQHCYETVTLALLAVDGVASVSFRQNIAVVIGEPALDHDTIIKAVKNAGYETDSTHISRKYRKAAGGIHLIELPIIAAVLLLAGFAINRVFGYNIFNAIPTIDSKLSFGMLLVTGLLTSVHCVGMCGAIGLYASSDRPSSRSLKRPLLYNIGRVVSYTIIGGLVGLLGRVITFSSNVYGVVLLFAAVFMLLMSLGMMGLFRFRLPHFCSFPRKGKGGSLLIGLMNGFMPCGPLQAMQLYALSTGSFLYGAISMFLFAIGTVPLMLGSGALINLTKGKARILIGKAASVLVFILSVSMLFRGLAAFGIDFNTILQPKTENGYITATMENGIQSVSFDLEYDTYADIIVQKNIPVRMMIHAEKDKITGCNNEVISNDFGFDVVLQPGDNVIEFMPEQAGEYLYTCWMNMIRNHIRVVNHIKE